jgi:hypothetical protein
LALSGVALLFALALGSDTYLINADNATAQHLAASQQYLQQRAPQARSSLQTLALRVNQSVPRSPALRQVLVNLRLQVNPVPPAAAEPGPALSH